MPNAQYENMKITNSYWQLTKYDVILNQITNIMCNLHDAFFGYLKHPSSPEWNFFTTPLFMYLIQMKTTIDKTKTEIILNQITNIMRNVNGERWMMVF